MLIKSESLVKKTYQQLFKILGKVDKNKLFTVWWECSGWQEWWKRKKKEKLKVLYLYVKFLLCATFVACMTDKEGLHKLREFNLTSLSYRRIKDDIETFKIMKKLYDLKVT